MLNFFFKWKESPKMLKSRAIISYHFLGGLLPPLPHLTQLLICIHVYNCVMSISTPGIWATAGQRHCLSGSCSVPSAQCLICSRWSINIFKMNDYPRSGMFMLSLPSSWKPFHFSHLEGFHGLSLSCIANTHTSHCFRKRSIRTWFRDT